MKTHKHYNVGDMFIREQITIQDGRQYEKSIYYIIKKEQYRKGCHYKFELIRLDEHERWSRYYNVGGLNTLILYSSYKHIPVVK
jgi:hypothetical protein